MATMKAVQVSKANGPFEVVEREIPDPGPGQVRIKNHACGLNRDNPTRCDEGVNGLHDL